MANQLARNKSENIWSLKPILRNCVSVVSPIDKASYKASEVLECLKETPQLDGRNVKVTCSLVFYSDRTMPQIKSLHKDLGHYPSVLRESLKDNRNGNYIIHEL